MQPKQISVYRTVGGNAALGPRIYEGAVTAEGGDWGSPNILPPASFHSATPLINAGGKKVVHKSNRAIKCNLHYG